MENNNVAIVGSRNFNDYKLFCKIVDEYRKNKKIDKIVSGKCPTGADQLAERYAEENNIPTLLFPAEWKKYGDSAGPIRNKIVIDNATDVIAFPSKYGRGTQGTIKLAEKKGIKPTIIYID